jgi:hypothetical protein
MKSKQVDNVKAIAKYFADRNPDGKTDKGGRWYPDNGERCSCCSGIRSPSRDYPWSYWKHCKSIKHLKTLIQEHPLSLGTGIVEALTMTQDTAPLHMNSESKLLQHMVEEVYGLHTESNPQAKKVS